MKQRQRIVDLGTQIVFEVFTHFPSSSIHFLVVLQSSQGYFLFDSPRCAVWALSPPAVKVVASKECPQRNFTGAEISLLKCYSNRTGERGNSRHSAGFVFELLYWIAFRQERCWLGADQVVFSRFGPFFIPAPAPFTMKTYAWWFVLEGGKPALWSPPVLNLFFDDLSRHRSRQPHLTHEAAEVLLTSAHSSIQKSM